MADLVTHLFVAFAVFTVIRWRIDWIDRRWIAVGLVGSIVPDLNRIGLLISSNSVEATLGLPFNWGGIHTLGGIALVAAFGALLFASSLAQRRAFVVLLGGGLAHLIVDLPQRYADGEMVTNLYLSPLPPWRFATPGWYVSADRWVVVVAGMLALAVFAADRYLVGNAGE